MKFAMNRNKFYLVLTYLSISYIFIKIVDWEVSYFVFSGFIITLLLFQDTILDVIQQFTGDRTNDNSLIFFSALNELNKKIQHYHEADEVLTEVEKTLLEKIQVKKVMIFINGEFHLRRSSDVFGKQKESKGRREASLVLWKNSINKVNSINDEFEQEINITKGIVHIEGADGAIKRAMTDTNTNLVIPISQQNKILCTILVDMPKLKGGHAEFEDKMLEFMANQLFIVLDRIQIYEKMKKKTALLHAEKMQVMQSLSTSIAHEMRTPLSGIRASIIGVETYLEDLTSGYQYAVKNKASGVDKIREDHLQKIIATPKRITLMIDQANAVIDMLLMNLRDNALNQAQLNNCSAARCINEAVDRYPFKTGEFEKVKLSIENDFKFLGVDSLFVYIIFNLMKNSLYAISSLGQVKGKSNIEITLRTRDDKNQLIFRDSGEGIDSAVINKIFDGFFTTKNDGTGVGLAYCQRTMESFGGTIACQSEIGSYTEFVLTFPILDA